MLTIMTKVNSTIQLDKKQSTFKQGNKNNCQLPEIMHLKKQAVSNWNKNL